MRGWKITALLASWAAMGLSGCANDTATPAEVDEERTEEGAAPEASEETGEAAQSQVMVRPPICRSGYRVKVGPGYICRAGDLFPRPDCLSGWRLARVGSGYLCEHRVYEVPTPPPAATQCTSSQDCYAYCGAFGGRCIFHRCYCY